MQATMQRQLKSEVRAKAPSGRTILLLYFYGAMVGSWAQIIGGDTLRNSLPIDALVNVIPLILGVFWLLIKFAPGKVKASTTRIAFQPIFIFWLGFGLVLAYSIFVGSTTQTPFFVADTYSQITLFLMPIIAYFSIRQVDDVIWLMRRLMPVLFVMAVMRLIILLIIRIGVSMPYGQSWTDNLLLALGLAWYLSDYLVNRDGLRKLLILTIFGGALLVDFHKPIVWTVAVGFMAMLWIIGFWSKVRNAQVFGRLFGVLLVAITFLVIVLGITEVILNTGIIETYVQTFDRAYLKLRPDGSQGILDGGRFELWANALQMFLENPLLGYGTGVGISTSLFTNVAVHNTVLYSLVAWGFIGSFFFFGAYVLWLKAVRNLVVNGPGFYANLALLTYSFMIIAFGLIGVMWFLHVISFLSIVMGMLYRLGCNSNSLLATSSSKNTT